MKKTILMLAMFAALFSSAIAQQSTQLTSEFDKVLKEEFRLNGTGITVLVSKGGQVIYTKALGNANIELNVPMQINNVFRIASVTKQFTATAILQLMEQGKLNVQDEITRFIPDYPTQGAKITIEHLLTHTSGIVDYASIPDTVQRGKIDVTPVQMIEQFRNHPMRFAPGTKYEYSNSNYFLLGYIIEKISGKTYGQYLDENIFKPLGMTNSSFASDTKLVPNRAAGYTQNEKSIENAPVISMTRPYAAGAILSTVEDLAKWNQAVQAGKLIKKETLAKAYTRYKLVNGKDINYGYGVRNGFIQESPSIWHGGLINGFMSMAMYLPNEDVYVAILSNCDCVSPERATAKLAAIAIGKPYVYTEIPVDAASLQSYAGVYENPNGDQILMSVAENKLFLQRGNNRKVGLKAFKKNNFFFDDPLMSAEFTTKDGKTDKLIIKTRNGNEVWNKTDKTELNKAVGSPGTELEFAL